MAHQRLLDLILQQNIDRMSMSSLLAELTLPDRLLPPI